MYLRSVLTPMARRLAASGTVTGSSTCPCLIPGKQQFPQNFFLIFPNEKRTPNGQKRAPTVTKRNSASEEAAILNGDPNGIRTRVTAVKGRCPNRWTIGSQKSGALCDAGSGVASGKFGRYPDRTSPSRPCPRSHSIRQHHIPRNSAIPVRDDAARGENFIGEIPPPATTTASLGAI